MRVRAGTRRYGIIARGASIHCLPRVTSLLANHRMYRLAILTISSSGARGEREDTGGQAIRDKLPPPDYEEVLYEIVSDDAKAITDRIGDWADSGEVDLIVTTGGTGMGRRDVTPEAARSAMDREVPGMAETMRAQTLQFTPMAMLSRFRGGNPRPHPDHHPARQSAWRRRVSGRRIASPAPRHRAVAARLRPGPPALIPGSGIAGQHGHLTDPCCKTETNPTGDRDQMSTDANTTEQAPIYWPRVKELLDGIMERWIERHGRDPYPGIHEYWWETPEELAASVLNGYPSIEPGKPGAETPSCSFSPPRLRHFWANAPARAIPVPGRSRRNRRLDRRRYAQRTRRVNPYSVICGPPAKTMSPAPQGAGDILVTEDRWRCALQQRRLLLLLIHLDPPTGVVEDRDLA